MVATFQKYDEPDVIVLRNDWPSKTWTFEIHPIVPNQCNVTNDLIGLEFYNASSTPFIPLNDNFFYQTAYIQFLDVKYNI